MVDAASGIFWHATQDPDAVVSRNDDCGEKLYLQ